MEIYKLLAEGVRKGASDLHLSAGLPPRFRIDGDLRPVNLPALAPEEAGRLIREVMSESQAKEYAEYLECDFAFELPGLARFRVNAFRQNRGPGAVFRIVPASIRSLSELGMGAIFTELARISSGLILVTGPTGSGKSATLAALLDYVNSHFAKHLLTLEDPIEFIHESKKCLVSQREVGRDTRSFSRALRAALREDPDIILVGEMRDLPTIRLALEAAETGHTVFSTLHTSSAAKTIDRIVDVFPAGEKTMVRTLLAESLQAVIAQRLLKKTGGGRCAAREIMICTSAIRNLIREGKTAQIYSAMQTGGQHGMATLDQSLRHLLEEQQITREVALSAARHPGDFS